MKFSIQGIKNDLYFRVLCDVIIIAEYQLNIEKEFEKYTLF